MDLMDSNLTLYLASKAHGYMYPNMQQNLTLPLLRGVSFPHVISVVIATWSTTTFPYGLEATAHLCTRSVTWLVRALELISDLKHRNVVFLCFEFLSILLSMCRRRDFMNDGVVLNIYIFLDPKINDVT